jgi:hypothetical protein
MSGVHVHVLDFGLQLKFDALKERELKRANKTAVSKAATRGKTLAKGMAPKRTGVGAAGIRKTSASGGVVAIAKVYVSGPHAHIMRWQDQGTGERHKHDGQSTGMVEPQYFMERAGGALEGYLPAIMEAEVEAAIIRSGLA